jgi:hypothetical protein
MPPHAPPSPDSSEVVPPALRTWIVWSPIVLAIVSPLFFCVPRFDRISAWIVAENHPVEMLTFLSLMAASLWVFALSRDRRFTGGDALATWFFVLFGIGVFFTAMEEIAWGQTFFHFDTPTLFVDNLQDQTTLHNMPGIQGHNGLLRLGFGLGGLIGIALARVPRLARMATPRVLLSWFLTITALQVIDVYLAFRPAGTRIDLINEQMDEVVEMMIGFAAFLYVWLLRRRAVQVEKALPAPPPRG